MTCDEDLVADVQSTIAGLRQRQSANRKTYDDATSRGEATIPGISEYLGLPFMYVPFSRYGDGERPLPGRPDSAPPLRSAGLSVTENGNSVDRLRPNRTYEITAEVRNDGDMDVPPTIVEFFVDHRPEEIAFDTTDGYAHIGKTSNQKITGWTTLPPGSKIGYYLQLYGTVRPYATTVEEDRTFTIDIGWANFSETGHLGRIIYTKADGEEVECQIMVTDDPVDDRGPIPLGIDTHEAEFIGMERARLPADSKAEVSVEYTTPPADEQKLGVFYVRSYSLVPADVPDGWGRLDHRADRHVGRTEVSWE